MALFYRPTQRPPEYSRLLLQLAACFHPVGELLHPARPPACCWTLSLLRLQASPEHRRLQDASSRFDALAQQLRRTRQEAEYTAHFWRSFPGKMTVESPACPPPVPRGWTGG